jgi:hypothetical protein
MMPHEVNEAIAKVLFFIFATVMICMTRVNAAEELLPFLSLN